MLGYCDSFVITVKAHDYLKDQVPQLVELVMAVLVKFALLYLWQCAHYFARM